MVQWLGLLSFTTEGAGSIPGRETMIPLSHAVRPETKTKAKTNKQKK